MASNLLESMIREALEIAGTQSFAEQAVWVAEQGGPVALEEWAAKGKPLKEPGRLETLETIQAIFEGGTRPNPTKLHKLLQETHGPFRELVRGRLGEGQGRAAFYKRGQKALFLVGSGVLLLLALGVLGISILMTNWLWLGKIHPVSRFPPADPGQLRGLDIYLVFTGWLCLYFTVSAAGPLLMESLGPAAVSCSYALHGLGGLFLIRVLIFPGQSIRTIGEKLFGGSKLGGMRCFLFGLGGYAVALPVIFFVGWATRMFTGTPPVADNPIISIFLGSGSWLDRATLAATVLVLAPIFEEILFRGLLLPAFRQRIGVVGGLSASALLFAFIHFDAQAFPLLAALGFILGFVAHKSGSLWPAIVTHGLWNTQSLLSIEILRQLGGN